RRLGEMDRRDVGLGRRRGLHDEAVPALAAAALAPQQGAVGKLELAAALRAGDFNGWHTSVAPRAGFSGRPPPGSRKAGDFSRFSLPLCYAAGRRMQSLLWHARTTIRPKTAYHEVNLARLPPGPFSILQ